MIMEKFKLQAILDSMKRKPLDKAVFCITDHLKAQVMRLEAGSQIPPCKMDNDVLFYYISGEGTITIDNETREVMAGECVVVPYQAESRSIHATTDLKILAVQGITV
jgi:mannose-6-phosphate isomerase-like protein (cupin superfamily)